MPEKTVRDLMLSLEEYATVRAGCTVREALAALDKAQLGLTDDRHHHRAVLVLDAGGAVIGKLSHWAILRSLEPSLLNDEDLASLDRAGLPSELIHRLRSRTDMFAADFGRMCASAARVRVEQAMAPVTESIADDVSLAEAIRCLVVSHCQSLLVRHQGQVVGILRLSDVVEEVADRIRGTA